MRRRLLPAVLTLAFLLAACGSNSKVGDRSLLDFKEQVNKDRLGAATTTTTTTVAPGAAAPVTTAPPAGGKAGIQTATTTSTTAAPATTQAPTTQPPTTQAPEQFAEISINGDDTAQFSPSQLRVFKGTKVRWTNKDSVPRSVESDDSKTFASGQIAPGASYVLTTAAIGQFNYHDGSRPYAVASLEVLPRG